MNTCLNTDYETQALTHAHYQSSVWFTLHADMISSSLFRLNYFVMKGTVVCACVFDR